MILPRFSIRTVLIVVTVAAVFFVVLGDAVQGKAWAVGIAVGVTSVLVTFAFHGLFYGFCTALVKLLGSRSLAARTSQGALRRESTSTNAGQEDG